MGKLFGTDGIRGVVGENLTADLAFRTGKTICWCGKKAAFNARFDAQGHVVKQGAQVVIGANDQYIGLCRKHWMLGDLGPDFNGQGTGD